MMRPALLDPPLSSWYVNASSKAVTRSGGVYAGEIQLGDGVTPATFPGQLGVSSGVKMGLSLNGSQYAQWLTPIPSGTYTVYLLVNKTVAAGSIAYLIDARAGGGAGYLWVDAGGALGAGNACDIYVNETLTTALPIGPVVCVAAVGISLSAPSALFFGMRNTVASGWTGNLYGFRLFPGTHTARQLRDQRQRMLARVRF